MNGVKQRLGDFELDISLDVAPATCLALVGPSGAGKTSLLRCVAGLARPDSGRIACDGERGRTPETVHSCRPRTRRCGYLFQDYALFPHLSAWQNVAYALGGPRAERHGRALELLGRFGLAGRADAKPRTLSGGERQRVALGARPRGRALGRSSSTSR